MPKLGGRQKVVDLLLKLARRIECNVQREVVNGSRDRLVWWELSSAVVLLFWGESGRLAVKGLVGWSLLRGAPQALEKRTRLRS